MKGRKKNNKIVLTYYWTGEHDVWHKDIDVYHADPREFDTLYNSVANRGYDFITLANELYPDSARSKTWKVVELSGPLEKPKDMSLYVHKFIACYQFLLNHPEYEEIWIVDSADTEMMGTPRPKDGIIYGGYDAYAPIFHQFYPIKYIVGGESDGVWLPGIFMMGHRQDDHIVRWLRATHLEDVAWNCGVFGGKRAVVMEFLEKFVPLLMNTVSDVEMVVYNYVLYRWFEGRAECITTRMTLGEVDMTKWWRHK